MSFMKRIVLRNDPGYFHNKILSAHGKSYLVFPIVAYVKRRGKLIS